MRVKVNYNKQWMAQLRSVLSENKHDTDASDGSLIRYAAGLNAKSGGALEVFDPKSDTDTSCRILSAHHWFKQCQDNHPSTPAGKILLFSAHAYLQSKQGKTEPAKDEVSNHGEPEIMVPGKTIRAQQRSLSTFLELDENKPFRICEASTGIGKGIALILSAIQSKKKHPKTQVVVTAPTISTLEQLRNDYDIIAKANNLTFNVAKTYSKAEFISKELALYWCEEFPDHKDRKRFMKHLRETTSWNILNFKDFQEIPLSELTILNGGSSSDPGHEDYQDSKSCIKSADIVFCTHAMVVFSILSGRRATQEHKLEFSEYVQERVKHFQREHINLPFYSLDNKSRVENGADDSSGFFSPDAYYLIDEAHQFKDSVRMICKDSVSFVELLKVMSVFSHAKSRPLLQAQSTVKDMERQVAEYGENPIYLRGARTHAKLRELELNLHKHLSEYCSKTRNKMLIRTLSGRRLLRYVKTIKNIAANNNNAQIETSKVREYVRLQGGSSHAACLMDFLTQSSSGIGLCSATLHAPVGSSQSSGYAYIAKKFSMPFDKVETHSPIFSDWLKKDVEVFVSEANSEFKPDHELFDEVINSTVQQLTSDINGGSMVLCTSYSAIKKIASAFTDKSRLIIQEQNIPTKMLAQKYITMYKNNENPIWLATGSAWTGLDLSDHEEENPELDKAIQQIIIPRLPFEPTSKTTVFNIGEITTKCLYKLKQGIGRLVRRPGRKGMKIYVLDGRAMERSAMYAPIRRYLLEEYQVKTLVGKSKIN
jgi:ATP-dependent DNA helicase DinG